MEQRQTKQSQFSNILELLKTEQTLQSIAELTDLHIDFIHIVNKYYQVQKTIKDATINKKVMFNHQALISRLNIGGEEALLNKITNNNNIDGYEALELILQLKKYNSFLKAKLAILLGKRDGFEELLRRRLGQREDSDNIIAYDQALKNFRKQSIEYINKHKYDIKKIRAVLILNRLINQDFGTNLLD